MDIHTGLSLLNSFRNIVSWLLNMMRGYNQWYKLNFSNILPARRVVASKNDAQLLMMRLGIDGFYCGKRKIFLKYYHMEYLSRFYDDQYNKIVTVQSAARYPIG